MEVLDLFSAAAGGWSLGMHRAGFKTIAACEFVEWRRALYSQNNPGVLIYDDVRTLTADQLIRDLGRLPSVIVGSPPCQDISSANTKGKGVEGERSGLYFEAVRIIGEVRPRWFALENSSNLRTRGADAVLSALEALGYACWSFVVRAGDIGANHERPRCWIVGCDVEQVTNTNGIGRNEGWSRWGCGVNLSVSENIGDTKKDGCRSRVQGRRVSPIAGTEQSPCRDALNAAGIGHESRWPWGYGTDGNGSSPTPESLSSYADHEGEHGCTFNGEVAELRGMGDNSESDSSAHAYQAGIPLGQMEPCIRKETFPFVGCDDGRSGKVLGGAGKVHSSELRQMGVRETDSESPFQFRSDWSLYDFANHLRVDDGLSAWVADTRIAVGGPRGTSAASLIVEAFGDAVVPQIPEAIGNAILRTEVALSAIYGRTAA